MRKCERCKTNPACPDGILCNTCRLLPKISSIKKQIGNIQPDKSAGYSQVYRNLTIGQIDALQERQAGRCAICGRKLFLVLDHDHKTGKARGYLCRGCNTKLAGIDDIDFMGRAREYLDNPPANKLSG